MGLWTCSQSWSVQFVAVLLVPASVVVACSSTSGTAPGADGGMTTDAATATDSGTTSDGATASDATSTSEAGSEPDAANACNTLSFGGSDVPFTVDAAFPPTSLAGGTIVDGTYDLVKVETGSTGFMGFTERSTYRFAGNVFEQINATSTPTTGVGVVYGASSTFVATMINNTGSFRTTNVCGTMGAGGTLSYDSSVVNGVQQFRFTGGLLMTFNKRP